ncbi:MAG: glutamate formiminotransferase / formiminotetrahydrofolate [Planctomycetota bacterium]|nr:MAG: glutamate formiminotransferase / formiminotetrahydrofolate [Planctomycetota bacterium]
MAIPNRLVECVPNFSEGRRPEVVEKIVAAIASVPRIKVLDESMDMDHNRSVVTFVGEPDATVDAMFRGMQTAADLIDMAAHHGAHPRLGATDVVPFVPLIGVTMEECVILARRLGEMAGRVLGIPIYLYAEAASRPERRILSDVRKGEYEGLKEDLGKKPERTPDFGPDAFNARSGATAVGARKPLIAYNIYLKTTDVKVAKGIAKAVRERDGGLPKVQALGLWIPERSMAQVSMNLLDYRTTGFKTVFNEVTSRAEQAGVKVAESELIGLVPRDAFAEVSPEQLLLAGFTKNQIIENRLED